MTPLHNAINNLIVTLGVDTKTDIKVSMPNEAINKVILFINSEVA